MTLDQKPRILEIFAPAKINLYLHITGRLENGYHTLDSLVNFADIGDYIKIEPAEHFSFYIDGPFAGAFDDTDIDDSEKSNNLAVRAARDLAHAANKQLNISITLTKHLPLASGIGGGSSDAAAVIWGLMEWWSIPRSAPYLENLLSKLGADVPVCLHCAPAQITDIGTHITPAPRMNEIAIVLINPMKAVSTEGIFKNYHGSFKDVQTLPDSFLDSSDLINFLKKQSNDLYKPACAEAPEIENIVQRLNAQKGCALARMSGSGATCFGIFGTTQEAVNAAKKLSAENPDWWVKHGVLNRPERY